MEECRSSQVLFDYLQKELPRDQMFRIEAHLPHCAACREELDRLRQQVQQVRATIARLDPDPGWPARLKPDLMEFPAHPASFTPLRRLAVAFTAAVVLILASIVLLSEKQSVLANSISRLKVIMDVSAALNRATSMDCILLKPEAGSEDSSYHLRWNAKGITRVDRESTRGVRQTLWISNTTVPPDAVWQPAMEFLTPAIVARHVEGSSAFMQTGRWDGAEPDEFMLVRRERQQVIEIAIDNRTYLPKMLRKYSPETESGEMRKCVLEVQFSWNRPVPGDLLIPRPAAGKRQLSH